MLTLLINETKPLAGLFASTTGGIGSVPDISVADDGQAVSVQTFTRTAGVITDSFVAGDVLHIGIGDGVNAPVCYVALSSASPAVGTMPINTAGMVALFAATVANQLSLQIGVVRTRGAYTNTIFSAPIVIHRSVIDPDTAVPTPSILGTGVAAALLVAINTALGFVRLDASARLPAVDGSQLTNLPGGGITDGDKGDITVSNSGATWTIDNDVITLAKLAHMPTARVLGRTTAGTGTPELLTISGTGSVAMTNSPTFTTPALGTPASGNFSTGTFTWPTFNQNTTGSAATLTTTRTIGGSNFDGSADVTSFPSPGAIGGTTPGVVNTTGLNAKDSSNTTTASIDGSDGSASFASGNCTISFAGGILSDSLVTDWVAIGGVNGSSGALNFRDSGGTTTAYISGLDGSASFASGALTIGTNTGTAAYIHSDGTSRLASIELGHATDTTLARVSAGVVSIEGATILVNGGDLGTPSAVVLTNASGTAASLTAGNVTTNANLTGHVTSVGNAAVLGSFTMAQLSAAVSDGDPAYVGAANTFTTGQIISSTTSLLLGTAGSAVGNVGFRNATSGTTTLAPATGALGTGTVTLPLSGTLATLAGTETLTNKRLTQRSGTATSSATPTINTDNVDFYSLTAQAADITSFTTNLSGTPTEGQTLWIAITGTAARAITWGATFEAGAVALPTTTVTTTRLDVAFVWNTVTSKWRCMASG